MVVLIPGLSAAIALWAFEFGTDIAGLDRQSKDELAQQLGCIEAENLELKADLGFFQRLQPAASEAGLMLCTMRATLDSRGKTRCQLLARQNGTGAAECASHYAIVLAGTRNGRPWNCGPAGTAKPLQLRQYVRVEAESEHPQQAVVGGTRSAHDRCQGQLGRCADHQDLRSPTWPRSA